jgi:ribosome biogenesis protein MAK21
MYLNHHHPTVSKFAHSLVSSGTVSYTGDVLADFTLIRFLDKFMFKNPKKKTSEHGGSIMQRKPVRGDRKESQQDKAMPFNAKRFAGKTETDVSEDQVSLFFLSFSFSLSFRIFVFSG